MCKLDYYVKDQNTTIGKCHGCKTIQIAHGNFIMSLDKINFNKVFEMISHCFQLHTIEGEIINNKMIAINTQVQGLYLRMDLYELQKLNEFLHQAKLQIEVDQITFDDQSFSQCST